MRLYDIVITSLLGGEAVLWADLEITFSGDSVFGNGQCLLERPALCSY